MGHQCWVKREEEQKQMEGRGQREPFRDLSAPRSMKSRQKEEVKTGRA